MADVIGPTGVTISWNSEINQGAIGYRVGGKPQGAASFAFVKVPAPNTSLFVSSSILVLDTTYEWRVEAVCVIDGSIRTAESTDSFYVPPFLRLSNPQIEVKVYPNPTTSFLYIEGVDLARLELFDINGKLILNQS